MMMTMTISTDRIRQRHSLSPSSQASQLVPTHLHITMSRTTRSSKSTAPSPAPLSHIHSAKAMETLEKAVQETGIEVDEDALPSHAAPAGEVEENEAVAERAKVKAKGKGTAKGKGKGKATSEDEEEAERERAVEAEQAEEGKSGQSGRVSPEERLAKLKELRMRMVSSAAFNIVAALLTYLLVVAPQNQSTQANRKSLIEDHQKSKTTHRELARLTKQKKLAENLREKIDNEENGVDGERKKNWGWTIEQNQRWLKAEEEKAEKEKEEFDGEFESTRFVQAAHAK